MNASAAPVFGRLGRYTARHVVIWTLGLFGSGILLIFLVDTLEMYRRVSDVEGVGLGDAVSVSALRLPWLGEQLVPFATLFGSMVALLGLSRKLELVVARAAGLSVWNFLALATVAIFAVGVFFTTVYNPIAASAKAAADAREARLTGAAVRSDEDIWLRQTGADGRSIVRAAAFEANGARLLGVTFFVLGEDGRLATRVEAAEATLARGAWRTGEAWVTSAETTTRRVDSFRLAAEISVEAVRDAARDASSTSFWNLPQAIERGQEAGVPAFAERLEYHALIVKPLLLVAMLLIASCVALRLFRAGGIARVVLYGIIAGFGLYIVTKLFSDLGSAGILNPFLAAWVPPLTASLLACGVLLRTEDG